MSKRVANPAATKPVADDIVTQRLRSHLKFLGLTFTQAHLDELLAWATRERPTAGALLEHVLGREVEHKLEQRITSRVERSGLKERKTLEAFDFDFQPSLPKATILELAGLDFVARHDDILITGNPGTGKSHILKAFGLRACEKGIRMRYSRCVDLLDDLYAGLGDGSYSRRLKKWSAAELLIIDDVGLGQVKKRDDEPTAAHTLYNLIDKRHGRVSTAITSNIALADWGKYLGDATITAAILDRLAMHAIRIDVDGPSYRQHVAKERAAARGSKPRERPSKKKG
ncbi:MAG TPA: IS21-like element helper ATPase IstB [Arachnia sp.]|nr:IS21-like element helper ATPase IstB [Arachnia sp.]